MVNDRTDVLLLKLIAEAPEIAPSITRFEKDKKYGYVTDEKLNSQGYIRWELQARSLIARMAESGEPIFRELSNEYDALKVKSKKFHSRSIMVHMVMQLLVTARDLGATSDITVDELDTSLDPWPVIRGLTLELSSYEVPQAIDKTGLMVDWSLNEKQDFSEETRKAAYRTSIDAAYSKLASEDKLRIAYVLAKEMTARGLQSKLNSLLLDVGWSIDQERLAPRGTPVRELFFSQKTRHDAYVEIRAFLQVATKSITVVDPYMDQSTLKLLASAVKPEMRIRLLTTKLPSDFAQEAKAWSAQYPGVNLEVRTTKAFHDRFVVLDDVNCWHVGASLKDAGAKAFMLSQIEDSENRRALTSHIESSWINGSKLPGV